MHQPQTTWENRASTVFPSSEVRLATHVRGFSAAEARVSISNLSTNERGITIDADADAIKKGKGGGLKKERRQGRFVREVCLARNSSVIA